MLVLSRDAQLSIHFCSGKTSSVALPRGDLIKVTLLRDRRRRKKAQHTQLLRVLLRRLYPCATTTALKLLVVEFSPFECFYSHQIK